MIYNKEALWKAIDILAPDIAEARKMQTSINITDGLKWATLAGFDLLVDTKLISYDKISDEKVWAICIIYNARLDLKEFGEIRFGSHDE